MNFRNNTKYMDITTEHYCVSFPSSGICFILLLYLKLKYSLLKGKTRVFNKLKIKFTLCPHHEINTYYVNKTKFWQ